VVQYSVTCGGRRWLVGGLHQQPCSHQSTARVGHCKGVCFSTLMLWQWKRLWKNGWVPSTRLDKLKVWSTLPDEWRNTKYSTMDEQSMHLGRALTGRTSTARIFYLHKKSLWEEDGNEDNMAAPDIHQRGGDVNPSEEGLVRLPLRGLENSMCTPSSREGGGEHATCR
jgi:hypothetical protein